MRENWKANLSNIRKQLITNILHPPYETMGTDREKIIDNMDHGL